MLYEVFFLDHGGKAFSKAELQADSDQAAIELADRVHRTGIGSGHEIRRDGVVIHFEDYGPSASCRATAPPACV